MRVLKVETSEAFLPTFWTCIRVRNTSCGYVSIVAAIFDSAEATIKIGMSVPPPVGCGRRCCCCWYCVRVGENMVSAMDEPLSSDYLDVYKVFAKVFAQHVSDYADTNKKLPELAQKPNLDLCCTQLFWFTHNTEWIPNRSCHSQQTLVFMCKL
jgi:hypothetical protein